MNRSYTGQMAPNPMGMGGLKNPWLGLIGDAVADYGYGVSQAGFGNGWQIGADRMRQMQPVRAEEAQRRQEIADAAQQKNATMEYLRRSRPDLAEKVDAGMPIGEAWNAIMAPPAQAEPFTLGPGQVRYGGDGSVIAKGGPDPQAAKDAFGYEKDLYQQYANADPVKTYTAVRDGYERVRASAQEKTGAGDMGLLYGYMRLLDPGSVVRESEFAMAAQAGSLPEQIQGWATRLMNGERLPESVRQAFIANADRLYAESAQNLGDINTQFTERANQWGVDPGRFVRQPEQYPALSAGGGLQVGGPPVTMAPGVTIRRTK